MAKKLKLTGWEILPEAGNSMNILPIDNTRVDKVNRLDINNQVAKSVLSKEDQEKLQRLENVRKWSNVASGRVEESMSPLDMIPMGALNTSSKLLNGAWNMYRAYNKVADVVNTYGLINDLDKLPLSKQQLTTTVKKKNGGKIPTAGNGLNTSVDDCEGDECYETPKLKLPIEEKCDGEDCHEEAASKYGNPTTDYFIKQMQDYGNNVFLTDKAQQKLFYTDRDNTIKSYPVITGKNNNPKDVTADYNLDQMFEMEKNNPKMLQKAAVTPIGSSALAYRGNIYGKPGLQMTNPKFNQIAAHTLYPGELAERTKRINSTDINQRCYSWGCINMKGEDLAHLTEFYGHNKTEPDSSYVIDSRLSIPENQAAFKLNSPKKQKFGGVLKAENTAIVDPRQDSYYTPSSSDVKRSIEQNKAKNIGKTVILPEVNITAPRAQNPTELGKRLQYSRDENQKLKDVAAEERWTNSYKGEQGLGNDIIGEQIGFGVLAKGLSTVNSEIGRIGDNYNDLKFAEKFANKYGYEKPSYLKSISNTATDNNIKQLANQHNTFVRGVSTNFEELSKRAPEVVEHLKNAGIDLKTQPEEAAKYMSTHIPIKTGYGRAGMTQEMFNSNLDGIYTSNSMPTAEGYTYGNGYQVRVKRPTDFSSSNRQDWITKNDFDVIEHRPLTALESDKMEDLKSDTWDSHRVKFGNEEYAKYKDRIEVAKDNKDWLEKQRLENEFQKNADYKHHKWAAEQLGLDKKLGFNIDYKPGSILKMAAKKNSPYAHYVHLGNPETQVLEATGTKQVTPEIYNNKSRAHIGQYSEGFSKKKFGGNINSDWEIVQDDNEGLRKFQNAGKIPSLTITRKKSDGKINSWQIID